MKDSNPFEVFTCTLIVAVSILTIAYFNPKFEFFTDPKWYKSFKTDSDEEIINMRYSKVVIDGHQYIEEYAMLGNVLSRTHCPDCKYCKNK